MITRANAAGTRSGLTRRAATLLLGAIVLGLHGGVAAAAPLVTPDLIARSRVATGNTDRLRRVFAKARRGEPVTLGVIGGSITAGAFVQPETSYAGRVLAWWRARFPQSELRLVNAGVGGTGSIYGALRAQKDLLVNKPDFVIVEFAVNDAWTDGEPFEGLIRQILAQPNAPAVLLLFMMWERGGNDQDMQAKVGHHYNLPMVSFRDAFWPEIDAGRLRWSDLIVDTVHPNEAGHAAAANLVTALLETADNDVGDGPPPTPLPAPLYSDAFQYVDWQQAAALVPSHNDAWSRGVDTEGKSRWIGTEASGRITFDWTGTGLVAIFARPPNDQGRVQFWIDGVLSQVLDTNTVIKRNILVVAEGLAVGQHSVTIERIDEVGSNPANRSLAITGLGAIGVRSASASN
jgi:lysophospholipase L1-like esterase